MNERQFLLQTPSVDKVIENAAYATALVRKMPAFNSLTTDVELGGIRAKVSVEVRETRILFWFDNDTLLFLARLKVDINQLLAVLPNSLFTRELVEACDRKRKIEELARSFFSLHSAEELAEKVVKTGLESGIVYHTVRLRFFRFFSSRLFTVHYHCDANILIPNTAFLPLPNCIRTVRYNSGYQLHCDGGPALVATTQEEGEKRVWEWYFLNGVRVPKEIATTPAEKLDPRLLLETDNAEVRREIVRKIGIERVCKALNAKVIDRKGDYELLLLDLRDGRKRPYLKMRNPSLGVYHIEGVHPSCNTVVEALRWRNGSDLEPELIS